MRKFKVIALSCGTEMRRKPFDFGDIVTENDFAKGMADVRLQQGFLKEIKEGEEEKEETILDKTPDLVSVAELAKMSDEDRNAYMKKHAEALGLKEPELEKESEKEYEKSGEPEVKEDEVKAQVEPGDEMSELAKKAIDAQAGEVTPSIDDLTKKQIVEKLTEMNIQFNANESKETLYNLMIQK